MITSGFSNAPVTKFLVFYTVVAAFVASITDSQYLLYIQVVPHLWVHGQWWRVLTWQACFANSTEVLFAAMTFYHLRVIERLWGSRKFASFIVSTLPYTTILPPLILALIVRPLTFNHANYLPAGPTPLLFALLAQYHAAIPHVYKYRLASSASNSSSSSSSGSSNSSPTEAHNTNTTTTASSSRNGTTSNSNNNPDHSPASLILTSKTLSYLLPAQLALSALPGSAISAAVGWCIGYAWRSEVLPWASAWRVPAWLVGESAKSGLAAGVGGTAGGTGAQGRQQEFEGLRRRMEREAGAASGREGGGQGDGDGVEARRRGTLGGLLAGQFGGAER